MKENDNEMMIMLIAFYGIFACVSCAFVFVLVSGKENEVLVEVNLEFSPETEIDWIMAIALMLSGFRRLN